MDNIMFLLLKQLGQVSQNQSSAPRNMYVKANSRPVAHAEEDDVIIQPWLKSET